MLFRSVLEPVSKEEFQKAIKLRETWRTLMLQEVITKAHMGSENTEDDEPEDVTPTAQKRKTAKRKPGSRF